MIISPTRKPHRLMAEINIVPYIDVMLVLMIIFMITTPLLTQGVDVNLPQTKAKLLQNKNQYPIVVSVDQQGRYYINVAKDKNKPINGKQLQTLVEKILVSYQSQQQIPIILVKGDKNANYGEVVKAMVLLQQTGVENVGLLTEDTQ